MSHKKVTYSWKLRQIMAARGLNNISDLIPLLTEWGITLSASQIYRLVGDRPERISLTLLGALIDALDCTVEDLCSFQVEAAATPKAVNAEPSVIDLSTTIRPKRACIRALALEVSTSTACRSVLTPPGPGGHPSVGGS